MSRLLEIGQRIHTQSVWMGKPLIELADRALTEFEKENYDVVVSKVATCLEGTLKKLLNSWQVSYDRKINLGNLIGVLRNTERAPNSLLERLGQANSMRNCQSHDQPPDEHDKINEGDSLLILNILDLTLAWCAQQIPAPDGQVPADLPIFLSVGTAHRLDQFQFLQHLGVELRNLGVEIRSLSGEYSKQSPFDEIREIMVTCRGALVVGLERSHAYTVFEREQSKKQKLYSDQYIPTAWNQIEGAMASALKLEILILKDRRVRDEGVFEAKSHRHRREQFDLEEEASGLTDDLRGILASWLKIIRTSPRSPTRKKG